MEVGVKTAQSPWAPLALFIFLLFAMKVFGIDPGRLLEPVASSDELLQEYTSGSRLNQLMIPALFAWAGMLFLSSRQARQDFIKTPAVPLLITALVLLLVASVAVSDHTGIAIRRGIAQVLFVMTAFMLALAIENKRVVYLVIGLAMACAMAIDIGLYAVLGTGMNDRGLFVGYLGNKNLAGNQYAIATMVFLYLAVSRKSPLFALLLVVSAGLTLLSESKTSMGAVAIFLVMLTGYRFPLLRAVVVLGTLLGCLAISMRFSLGGNAPEIFTNRGELWNFLSPYMWDKPFLGYGYQSFWSVGDNSINVTDGYDWITRVNTAHNGFMDIMLSTGLVGLVVVVGFLAITGLMLAARGPQYFLAHYLFIAFLIANVTESYLLYYQNIMWALFLVVVTATYVERHAPHRRRRASKRRVKSAYA